MGDDGIYVWGAYALALALMGIEVTTLVWRSRVRGDEEARLKRSHQEGASR
jgi:heme exporter protein CcmD